MPYHLTRGLLSIIIRIILIIYNVGQSDVNLSILALHYSRIPLVHGGFTAYLAVGGILFFPSSREKNSQLGIELPTLSFGFGYPSIVIW